MRPSALAVFRLITNSKSVGCKTGISAGFELQELSDVVSCLSVHPTDARTIAQKAARQGDLLYKAHRQHLERSNLTRADPAGSDHLQ